MKKFIIANSKEKENRIVKQRGKYIVMVYTESQLIISKNT